MIAQTRWRSPARLRALPVMTANDPGDVSLGVCSARAEPPGERRVGREAPDDGAVERLDHSRLPEHLGRMYRAAYAMTGSREDAEDLVQETYVRVMRRPRFVRKDNDLAYLMRTMRNTWMNVRRSRGAEQNAIQETGTLIERLPVADPMLSVEARAILAAVSELPPLYRNVIVAVDVLGLSYRDAASALRTREGTVMSRLFRARVQVGSALGVLGTAEHGDTPT
jgi:RNA polymerase sigma-70 factor (ECF subfamily)